MIDPYLKGILKDRPAPVMPVKTVWVGFSGNKVVAVCANPAVAEQSFRLSYSRRKGTITRENSDRGFVMEMTFKDDVTSCVERVTFSGHQVLDRPDHL